MKQSKSVLPTCSLANGLWLLGYVTAMILLVVFLFHLRDRQVAALSRPKSQQAWQAWRTAAAKQTGADGPVQRKIPKSAEPPALVLLRDRFGTVLAATLVFSTALYAMTMVALRGVFSKPPITGE